MAGQRIDISDPSTASARRPEAEKTITATEVSTEGKAKTIKIIAIVGMLTAAFLITAITQGWFSSEPEYIPPVEDPANAAPAP